MSPIRPSLAVMLLVALLAPHVTADTHYVSAASATPTAPYTNWATAATTVQAAVNEAANGDTVLVTNGVYVLSQDLVLNHPVTVRSVNGALHTTLDANNVCRTLNMSDTAALVEGFTLTRANSVTPNYVLGTVKKCIIRDCYSETMNNASGAVY